MKTLLFRLLVLMGLTLSTAWADSSPVPMLENAANSIISTLKAHKASLKSQPDLIHQAVQRALLPHVDVAGMSRSVLGRTAWMKATPSEKQRFASAFTQLVIRTYSSPLAEYSDEVVKFKPVRAAANARFLRVNSTIERSNGKSIPLAYSLVNKNGQWKIYDLSVEGVSLLQSFRSQFADALSHSTITDVIAQMNRQKKAG